MPSQLDEIPRERIIRGKHNWWFLGPGGVARLTGSHLTPDGGLQPRAEQHLRDQGLFRAPPRSVYSLTVLTSTDCNLGCGYCFQNTAQDLTGGDRPPRIAHARLTSDTITSILGFAERQMAKSGLDKLRLMLFGGEPLLNPAGCRELLARAADYSLSSATMISNLTLFTPRLARQLSDLGLNAVQATFDGDREQHDQIRMRRSHGGTFDTIVRNIASAGEAAPRIKWTLRVNVSHRNSAGIESLVRRLAAALDTSRCSIYFARVGDVGIGYGNSLTHGSELAALFAGWQTLAVDLGFQMPRPKAQGRCQTCGYTDGRFGAVVNADGILASCWETAGKPGWEVGEVDSGYLPGAVTKDRWISCQDNYQFADDEEALRSFQDQVDAELLDYLDQKGRLQRR